ncbi:MAG: M20/M25/M40 family metallo-hydrolase [Gemmatimonadaceae bacterium]|nr:M20/M25/M40 family metallo-hydrolase [Gemmatimonadaceae bacterium]
MRLSRAVAGLAALLLPSVVTAQEGARTAWDSLARSIFEELVEINTQGSTGSTLAAAQAMAARLKAHGFPDSDVVVIENAPKKGNLVARLRGRASGKKPILLLSHIDVVEARPEDWTLPPFEFIEKDGTFYGRGVADDKDEGAIGLTNLIRLKREGFVPDRDIVVALTTDEEGGPANGVDHILKNRPDLFDVEYAFNEGGGGRVGPAGKYVSHDVQASEKKYQMFTLEATNPGGHSSVPVRDNAITELSKALVKVGEFDFPVHLNEVTRAYFSRLSQTVDPELGSAMRAVVANPGNAAAVARVSRDPRYNSQMRTTCVATMLDGGHAPNALPQRARGHVNCRILPDESPQDVKAALERAIATDKVKVTMEGEARNSPPSPLTKDLMSEIERVTREMWPGIPVIPTMSTGATDGVYLRSSRIPTYGVSGLFYGETFSHGMNERIPVKGFYDGLEFMYRLVKGVSSTVKVVQ